MFICALIGFATMFFLPGGKAEQYSYRSDQSNSVQIEHGEFEPEITSIG